jgi:hypothetical protein
VSCVKTNTDAPVPGLSLGYSTTYPPSGSESEGILIESGLASMTCN